MARVWGMYSVSPHLEMKGLSERTVGNVHKGSKIGPVGIVHIATSHNKLPWSPQNAQNFLYMVSFRVGCNDSE